MTKISATVIADSLGVHQDRITTLLITFPRYILAEVNTHRMLSKNTSSSRAIPFPKMLESIVEAPFKPIAYQKHHKGMQGTEYFEEPLHIEQLNDNWLGARDASVEIAEDMYDNGGVTKQLANRLLEPYMWTTMLITGTDSGWDNFFHLRCPDYDGFKTKEDWLEHNPEFRYILDLPKEEYELFFHKINKGQGEIHIMDLAEKIYSVMNRSNPVQLKEGEWHIPFKEKIESLARKQDFNLTVENMVKVSCALAARTSYTVVGNESSVDLNRMLKLHDTLIELQHDSPLEHCAQAMGEDTYELWTRGKGKFVEILPGRREIIFSEKDKGWCKNYRGFIQHRQFIEEQKYLK